MSTTVQIKTDMNLGLSAINYDFISYDWDIEEDVAVEIDSYSSPGRWGDEGNLDLNCYYIDGITGKPVRYQPSKEVLEELYSEAYKEIDRNFESAAEDMAEYMADYY